MSAHTPGPWVQAGRHRLKVVAYDGPGDPWVICTICEGIVDGELKDPAIENGRLIAAAPDLLAALRGMVDAQVCGNTAVHDAALKAAHTAIAKAVQP